MTLEVENGFPMEPACARATCGTLQPKIGIVWEAILQDLVVNKFWIVPCQTRALLKLLAGRGAASRHFTI